MIRSVSGWTLPRKFLALVLAMGGVFAVINPPYAVNDEDAHLARVYELACGRWITRIEGSEHVHEVPQDYIELTNRYMGIRRRPEGRIDVNELLGWLTTPPSVAPLQRFTGRAGAYPPALYLPHVPAVWLAKTLGLPSLWHLYFARFGSLLAYAWLAWQAVRVAGEVQWIFVVTGLLPMALVQAAGVSGDGLIIGTSLLFFSVVARYGIVGAASPTWPQLVALTAMVLFLAISKPVYVVIVMSLPLLRWQGRYAKLFRWGFPCLLVVLAAAAYIGWTSMNPESAPDPKRSPSKQLAWLIAHPFALLDVLANTAFKSGDDLMIQFVALKARLAERMRFLGGAILVIYAELLALLAWGSARGRENLALTRAWSATSLFLTWLCCCGAIAIAMYLAVNRIGHDEIVGLQGRYFIPCAPPLLLGLSLLRRPALARWLTRRHTGFVLGTICAMNAATLFGIFGWQYLPPSVEWPY
jgi:hypothetical protein